MIQYIASTILNISSKRSDFLTCTGQGSCSGTILSSLKLNIYLSSPNISVTFFVTHARYFSAYKAAAKRHISRLLTEHSQRQSRTRRLPWKETFGGLSRKRSSPTFVILPFHMILFWNVFDEFTKLREIFKNFWPIFVHSTRNWIEVYKSLGSSRS